MLEEDDSIATVGPKTFEPVSSIELQSMVNSHEQPFVIIDRNYRIVAVNDAYRKTYSYPDSDAIGKRCFEVSHGRESPCSQEGEECPHGNVFDTGKSCVCAHVHVDANHRMHQVRVSAYPLTGSNGQLYLGECIEQVTTPDERRAGSERMVGSTPAFLACVKQLNMAAGSDAPVLLQGETGTGKELAAEYIHRHSTRSDKPFQIVDSTVLTDSLFEAEVFGHERGAYTGSVGEKEGLFQMAEGGTVFLDEIGDLPPSQQAKLLRVLETGQFRRVGGVKTVKCDVRILCATNRHLWEAVQAGTFREDLYYRIACLNIRLPSLRERMDDIPTLARNLIESINRTMRCSYHLTDDVFEPLRAYDYPGNVRELRNVLFIAATHSHNREINGTLVANVIRNLPQCNDEDIASRAELNYTPPGHSMHEPQGRAPAKASGESAATLKDIEADHIRQLLDRYGGNRKKVAETLGISERTVYRKLKKLGLN
jgi:two-component system response regulator AtoC